ncbi:hypothetical protein [Bacillus siamensis]|uniref:hypothetical protein n=1 Tax=Bacillus siamensis TaxID=659243 RepID=UPI003F677D2D
MITWGPMPGIQRGRPHSGQINVLPAFCVRYSSSAAMPRSTSCQIAYVSSAVIKSRLSHQAAS